MTTSARIVFVGAAGEMCRIAIERFAKAPGAWELLLTDIRPELLDPLVAKLPRGMASTQRLDLYDAADLRRTIAGADLVVLGAGPYLRTFGPVIEACLELKVPYLDMDDDVESTEHALTLDAKAKAAGIPIYVGCGTSPGHSNILAVDAARDLDVVEGIDVCWLIGEERPVVGRAVLEHMLHISGGDCLTWDDGRRVTRESFVQTGRFPILADEPELLLYETAHPEPVTLPRRFPEARRIRCFGGLDPAPLNGMFRGLARAIEAGKMSQKDAVDFAYDVATGGIGRPMRGWLFAGGGTLGQVRRGETRAAVLARYVTREALGRQDDFKGGILATAYGTKDGRPARSTRRTRLAHDRAFSSMGEATGTPCAAMALLALQDAGTRVGAFAPEDWIDPAKYYQALEAVGIPRAEIVEIV
ncbi:saccharopine dehydrogenase NADP-binding domain-containing protein [Nocardioides maradonensis]